MFGIVQLREFINGTGAITLATALLDERVVDMAQELVDKMNASGYRAEVVAAYQTVGGAPYLDYTDTVFGQVYEGMDVVDTIGQTGVDENQKPTEDITINSVSIETYQ